MFLFPIKETDNNVMIQIIRHANSLFTVKVEC